ncbi:MAG TPA: pilus assembly protein TadG-related protein [Tepidisphaeraceae bacterium]|jgi:Flp pilus assembly protein TadG|nr:pilus assembly protein TadG-related protein [Tepidisphaeraceae bacterium]
MATNSLKSRGSVMIYMMLAMVTFVGFVTLAVDLGHGRLVKNQLQGTADAAARSAATGLSTNVTTAQNNAVAVAVANSADGTAVVVDPTNDVVFGTWDYTAHTFTVLSGAARSNANAVRVTCGRTTAKSDAVKLSFGGFVGRPTVDVTASATAAVPTPHGIVGLNGITMSGTAYTDSYDASVAAYAAGSAGNLGSISSNSNIALATASVHGSALAGIGDSVSGGTVIGTRGSVTTPLVGPAVSVGNYATTNDNANVTAYMSSGSFSIGGSTAATMPGGNYYFKDFLMSGTSTLTITGPVTIYVTGQVNLSGSVNTPSNLPSSLKLEVASTQDVVLSGSTKFFMDVYAPQSAVTVSGTGGLFGSVVGSTLSLSAGSAIHYDTSLNSGWGIRIVQ